MRPIFPFQHLRVWQEAKDLTTEVYRLTKSFPDTEKYGIISQIRRASTSVCCNLAEGSGRGTKPDQRRFYIIAKASLMEVMNLVVLSHDLEFLKSSDAEMLMRLGKPLDMKLDKLISSRGKPLR
ncbi:MAG: four helix bundle protein [Bacteroidota bacterium]